ncbi:MAG: hypothetical protein L0H64_02675 [Pseudonocardia sp.]|nr:hypothetical protein [Pseudonocardia sp.]
MDGRRILPIAEVRSRCYSSTGDTLDYVYELDGDDHTIWAGEPGSPAHYRGRIAADGDSASGSWTYPGSGGYDSTMIRVAPEGRKR